ncbi:MOSC domain-containing protein [Erythrobacter litoralis]|uniref:MOSC domain-containing protein n=1 Tax=Erythrobacter litoralis TaxID=39960 RepID=UPI002434BBBA|nr:MOSC domain-containing protein [Erythrobacter litoralis]MDG6079638.1 MOSC domain-containing protein [Erythrobacter litoralis]
MNAIRVDAICAGGIAALPGGKRSGISKAPLEGTVRICSRGIGCDVQADRTHHGFPAMALHHYPAEHYDWLRATFGALPRLEGPGSMGENIAASGLLEDDVRIGDRFRLGTAMIEISQPRQPCATIEKHLECAGIVKAIVRASRCGWFYRVLEEGYVRAGDRLVREDSGHSEWTIKRTFDAVYGNSRDEDAMRQIANLDRVSDRLVHDISKRLSI